MATPKSVPYLAWLCLAGWFARLTCVGPGRAFWDEIYQFVEPAVWQWHGVGMRTWEYHEGMRNWILPTYYGALLRVAAFLRLDSLHTYTALQVINTLWSLLMIPAAYRLGLAVSRGRTSVAWLTAVLTAFMAPVVFYGATLLSELPAMICMSWAWTSWYELMQGRARTDAKTSARLTGLLLGAAVVLRYSFVLGAVPIALELAWRRQGKRAWWMLTGALAPVGVLAVFDTFAWGTPWHSCWAYFYQNIWQGKAASMFNRQSPSYYWDTMFRHHFRLGRLLLLPWALLFARRHARAVCGFLIPLVAFSCIDHKEERFACFTWPLLLVACSHGMVLALDGLKGRGGSAGAFFYARRHAVMALVVVAVVVSTWRHLRFVRYDADAYRAAAWVGAQPDCTGYMSDAVEGGGYFIFAKAVPYLNWDVAALHNDAVTYVAVHRRDNRAATRSVGDYRFLRYEGRFALFRRESAGAG